MRALATTEIVARIAGRTGVHVSTVWRALAGDKRISATTSEKILREAEKLRYRPNRVARQLATGRTNMVGLVSPPITSESYQKKINALYARLHDAGYDLLLRIAVRGVADERAAIADLRSRKAEGLIVVTQADDKSAQHLLELEQDNYPFVLFDSVVKSPDYVRCSVSFERFAVVETSLSCLVEHGHRNIAYLYPMGQSFSNKLESYLVIMKKLGLEPHVIQKPEVSSRYDFGYQAIRRNIKSVRKMSGLVAHCDRVAMGALLGLHEAGFKVPGEISVVSFDNDDVGEVSIPPLTTVAHPIQEMADAAVDVLLKRIQQPANGEKHHIRISPQLVWRSSVGSAPAC